MLNLLKTLAGGVLARRVCVRFPHFIPNIGRFNAHFYRACVKNVPWNSFERVLRISLRFHRRRCGKVTHTLARNRC